MIKDIHMRSYILEITDIDLEKLVDNNDLDYYNKEKINIETYSYRIEKGLTEYFKIYIFDNIKEEDLIDNSGWRYSYIYDDFKIKECNINLLVNTDDLSERILDHIYEIRNDKREQVSYNHEEEKEKEYFKVISKRELERMYFNLYPNECIRIKRFKNYIYIFEEVEYFDFENKKEVIVTNKYKVENK